MLKLKEKCSDILKSWDWKLFLFILLYNTLPKIYQSYSIFLVGTKIPTTNSLAIVSQWQFVQVLLEIIQETVILPVFFFIGSKFKNTNEDIAKRIKTVLFIIASLLILIITIFHLNIDSFIRIIDADYNIQALTKDYLGLKLWGSFFNILSIGTIVIVESLNKKKILLWLTCIKLILSICLDTLLYGGYTFSLNLGVKGVALSNLLVDLIIFFVAFFLTLRTINISLKLFFKSKWMNDIKLFTKIGIGSGVDSAVRNLVYFFMVLRMLNSLGTKEIGGYYLAMHIFWSFALVPILAISETSKSLISNYANNLSDVKKILKSSLLITSFIIVIWILTLPTWQDFIRIFNKDFKVLAFSFQTVKYLFVPYILLAYNIVIDSLFFGIGRTRYMAYQSIITNFIVYMTAYILYLNGFWEPNFENIMILFTIGIIVDSILTIYYAFKIFKFNV